MKKTISGFTVIEMLVVVSIIGVLTTIAFVSYSSIQASTRDSNRSSQLTVIAEYLETYYDDNGEYPSCNAMTADPDTIATNTLIGIDPKVFTDPTASAGSNSILPLCSEVTNETPNSFTYMGDGSSDCITESCPEYTLKYYENATGNIISISSRRSPSLLAGQPDAPVVDVTLNGGNVLATATPVTCSTGDIQYGIRYRTNDGVWSDYTTWSSTTTHSQAAAEGIKYGYQARSRCFVSDFAYSSSSVGVEDSYIHPFSSTPAAPTVSSSSLVWPTTQFSWTTPSCPAESSARYQYHYYTSYGYDSGWVATNSSPFSATTSQTAQTYYIEVQAQCFNDNGSSDWGSTGSTSYYRPTPNVQTLVIAGGGGGGAGDSYGNGGGGGAGGYIYNASLGLSAQGYAVTVGGGGSGTLANGSGSYWGRGTNGANSVFAGLTAIGGGGGGGGGDGSPGTGTSGGSGGGASGSSSSARSGASGTAGQGNAGGNTCSDDSRGSSGGGGATSAGGANAGCSNNGTAGGAGYTTSISGSSVCYAGGGGGGVGSGSVGAGQCGGGNGSQSGNGGAATANTGSGGGGGKTYGGNGGSGVVIIRYLTGTMGAGGGNSVYTSGSYTIHKFTSSGTFTVY